jgi:hypothetical protein
MRYMIIVKASEDTEAGIMPSSEQMLGMGRFNEEMINAGVLLAADGLHPSSEGARVQVKEGKRTVTDGPFAETKELVAGFWLLQVRSLEEALEWARKIPDVNGETTYEVRRVFDVEDFGDAATPEVRQQVLDLHAKAAAQQS